MFDCWWPVGRLAHCLPCGGQGTELHRSGEHPVGGQRGASGGHDGLVVVGGLDVRGGHAGLGCGELDGRASERWEARRGAVGRAQHPVGGVARPVLSRLRKPFLGREDDDACRAVAAPEDAFVLFSRYKWAESFRFDFSYLEGFREEQRVWAIVLLHLVDVADLVELVVFVDLVDILGVSGGSGSRHDDFGGVV